MLIVKATSLLSLLQIADIVLWADRLGAPNFLPAVGLVHEDWRWRYYLVLFVFYILVTWLSERVFEAMMRRAGKGILSEARV
jgi:polar amino acid transport system permease protein